MDDLAVDLTLHAIERISYLRNEMQRAVARLEAGHPARKLLQYALAETDVGEMKVWEPGEEPF